MGQPIDMGGEDLYVNAIYTGVTAAGLTPTTSGTANSEFARRYTLKGVNFNSANTDNAITLVLPQGFTRWTVEETIIFNASATLTTATFGLFTGAGGTGQTITTGTAITVAGTTAGAANSAQQSLAGTTVMDTGTTLFFRVQTAQGAPATGDVVISIIALS